jgi:hypothetical protein
MTKQDAPASIGDYFKRFFVGGSDERLRRLCAIVVDGKPLGDHPLNRTGSREEAKRVEELQWLGIALVGCDADLEVREVRTLLPRQGKATADFEVTMRSGVAYV